MRCHNSSDEINYACFGCNGKEIPANVRCQPANAEPEMCAVASPGSCRISSPNSRGVIGSDNEVSLREQPAIVKIDFAVDGKIVVAKDYFDFVLNNTK